MTRNPLLFVAAALCLSIAPAAPADDKPDDAGAKTYDPTDHYKPRQIEGWRVLVNRRLLAGEHEALRDETLELLADHLYRIRRVVPAPALAKLRRIPIWVELADPHHPCMCYHPSAGWLRDNGMNPEKAGAVEIANAATFLKWTHAQPWMVLHELAHGYHHQVLGFDHADVRAAYREAVAAKSYESVLHINGRKVRHYALVNAKEYFAEATEAYFGTNDFYPFVRAELKRHDPDADKLLGQLWKPQPKKK